jgi:hypothetical protein
MWKFWNAANEDRVFKSIFKNYDEWFLLFDEFLNNFKMNFLKKDFKKKSLHDIAMQHLFGS